MIDGPSGSGKIRAFAFLLSVLGIFNTLSHASFQWQTKSGDETDSQLIAFDFSEKTLLLENRITKDRTSFSSDDLVLSSKRKLVFSPIFHSSFPTETTPWPREKLSLFLLASLMPIVISIVGFWIAGFLITGKFSPFRALVGFLGSWLCGLILMGCYFYFSRRAGEGGGLIWMGAAVVTVAVSVYVSAIYSCSSIRGFNIFVLHLFVTIVLGTVLIFGAEMIFPAKKVESFWDRFVFSPTGLIHQVE